MDPSKEDAMTTGYSVGTSLSAEETPALHDAMSKFEKAMDDEMAKLLRERIIEIAESVYHSHPRWHAESLADDILTLLRKQDLLP